MKNTHGILQITDKGFGFLRIESNRFLATNGDPFVTKEIIREHKLAEGLKIECKLGKPSKEGQGAPVETIVKIEGLTPKKFKYVQNFEDIVSLNPYEQLVLETDSSHLTNRIIDIITPLGKGQRGAGPQNSTDPKAG